MQIVNVSSIARVNGSDLDYNLWLSSRGWTWATWALRRLGIGKLARMRAYSVTIGRLELFILDASRPDYVSLAVQESARLQRLWTESERMRYVQAKRAIAHLENGERKTTKAKLALEFGLSPEPYLQ